MSVIIYTKEQSARDQAERNRQFKAGAGRDMTYEDVILSWGGRFAGHSIVRPHQEKGRPVLVNEDL